MSVGRNGRVYPAFFLFKSGSKKKKKKWKGDQNEREK